MWLSRQRWNRDNEKYVLALGGLCPPPEAFSACGSSMATKSTKMPCPAQLQTGLTPKTKTLSLTLFGNERASHRLGKNIFSVYI